MHAALKINIQRYCVALFLTVAATWVRIALGPWVADRAPFATYLAAVIVTAWLVGTGPAIAALILGTLAAAHYIVPPENSLFLDHWGDVLGLLIYGITGAVAISLLDRTSRQHGLTRRQLQEIEQLSSELRAADSRKDEFLALLSHELRNPLAPIRSGIELLQRGDLADVRRQALLKTMSRQLEQLIRIVDDLLDVSRFVYGTVELDCRPVDLRELVETAVEQAQDDITERRHELQVVLPPQPVIVNADGIRVVQIITNLLTNAAKYTPREGTIHVLLCADKDTATLHVIDNGIGIPDEVKPHIFELFVRSQAAIRRDQKGLGLGLPLARHFAEMHHGRLELFSEGSGRGSRFTLLLPLAEPRTSVRAVDETSSSASAVTRTLPQSSGSRILIVDDNHDAAETLAMLLSLHDFHVSTVSDGAQALRMIPDFRPDVVLLDIGLPGMDGYEVARRLRADESLANTQIIAISGWGAQADIQKSRASGIDHHLVKPVEPDRLLRLLQPQPLVGSISH